jgi:hypothetical protein
MNRQERAIVCAVAIIPVTLAGVELIRCGCGLGAWILELLTAVIVRKVDQRTGGHRGLRNMAQVDQDFGFFVVGRVSKYIHCRRRQWKCGCRSKCW